MVAVLCDGDGWREFKDANAWSALDDGELRLATVSQKPEYDFERWVTLFPPGGWTGVALGDAVETSEYGFQPRRGN